MVLAQKKYPLPKAQFVCIEGRTIVAKFNSLAEYNIIIGRVPRVTVGRIVQKRDNRIIFKKDPDTRNISRRHAILHWNEQYGKYNLECNAEYGIIVKLPNIKIIQLKKGQDVLLMNKSKFKVGDFWFYVLY